MSWMVRFAMVLLLGILIAILIHQAQTTDPKTIDYQPAPRLDDTR